MENRNRDALNARIRRISGIGDHPVYAIDTRDHPGMAVAMFGVNTLQYTARHGITHAPVASSVPARARKQYAKEIMRDRAPRLPKKRVAKLLKQFRSGR